MKIENFLKKNTDDYEKLLLNSIFILFENNKIFLFDNNDENLLLKIIDYCKDYLDLKENLISDLQKQSFLFLLPFKLYNQNLNFDNCFQFIKLNLKPIHQKINYLLEKEKDIDIICGKLICFLYKNNIVTKITYKKHYFNFNLILSIDNKNFLSNNIKKLDANDYLLVKKNFKIDKNQINSKNYIKILIDCLIKKYNDFLEQEFIEQEFELIEEKEKNDKILNSIDILFLLMKFSDNNLKKIIIKNINLCYKAIPLITKNNQLYLYNLSDMLKDGMKVKIL